MNDTVANENVIAALRLADEATEDHAKFGMVASKILETAPPTSDENRGGVELLLRLHREGALKFEVTDGV